MNFCSPKRKIFLFSFFISMYYRHAIAILHRAKGYTLRYEFRPFRANRSTNQTTQPFNYTAWVELQYCIVRRAAPFAMNFALSGLTDQRINYSTIQLYCLGGIAILHRAKGYTLRYEFRPFRANRSTNQLLNHSTAAWVELQYCIVRRAIPFAMNFALSGLTN
jgi:hypothetical protein